MKNWNVRQEDIDAYLKVCKDAVEDDEVFAVFKSLPAYTKILEHTSRGLGKKYLNYIWQGYPHFITEVPFLENDSIGKPSKFGYSTTEEDLLVSPTTLQYLYVATRILQSFGNLDGKRIIEIGGGYGGQCKIIHDMFRPKSYSIIDLTEVSALQTKYLHKFDIDVQTFPGMCPLDGVYDLVISNYALSEITEPLQTRYVRNVLMNSQHGYITCNGPIHAMQEIKDKFPTFKISPDIEGERKENFIITW